jgi:GNAT superfamily N-acetyltransferase
MMAGAHDSTQTRLLDAADLPAVLALQQQAGDGLPAGFIRGKTDEELSAYLHGSAGVAYGITSGGTLLSMALMRLPTAQEPLRGECFPFVPEADWPLRAAILEHALVAPAARRRGHQQALICARIAHARRCAAVRWIAAGVQLANRTSWRNLMRSGLVIVKSRTQAGRTLLALLMRAGDAVLYTHPADQRWVIEHDADGHASALRAGYFGVRPGLGGTVIYQRQYAFARKGASRPPPDSWRNVCTGGLA